MNCGEPFNKTAPRKIFVFVVRVDIDFPLRVPFKGIKVLSQANEKKQILSYAGVKRQKKNACP